MFRLISLKIYDHPFLGNISEGLEFVPKNENNQTDLPYTTIIIGPNGTGKSSILALLVEIFEDLRSLKITSSGSSSLPFKYQIEYRLNNSIYKIDYTYKPNIAISVFRSDRYIIKRNEVEVNSFSEIELPSKIIAVAYLAIDRFRFKRNKPDDFYFYLGLRDQSNTARASSFLNQTLPLLFDYIRDAKSIGFLKSILSFLGFSEDFLGISYVYRYKEQFFTGNLTQQRFIELFENYSLFTSRQEVPFGVTYYQSTIKDNPYLIHKIVNYINVRVLQDSITKGRVSYLDFNLFENVEVLEELELLTHLRKLDLIASASLRFRKGVQQPISAGLLSSGEFHFLTTLIAIQSTIDQDSLILIDEPETSFHPNFQMKYIYFLKEIFKKYNSSHFILATHSHFLVSDLEGKSSEVICLSGSLPKITAEPIIKSTFGWSAEEVLFKVFSLRSTRNYFFEVSLRELLHHISNHSLEKERISILCQELRKTELDKNDPLTQILLEADEYVRNL